MRGVIAFVLLLAALAAPSAGAQPAVGEGCGPEERSLRDPALAFAARAEGPVRVFTEPGRKVRRTFGKINPNGGTTVFGVLSVSRDEACRPVWYRVQLPMRPNGSTGWIRANEVTIQAVRSRLEVDVSARRLAFFRDGRRVLHATAGVGTSGTPTPTGSYYVNQRFPLADATGVFGAGAIGISAFSPVLKDWAQGGPIAVHGTNDPSSVGRAASHGCIRIQNDVLRRILRAAEPGTPVLIHA
jgi:lipoprotein-anchoring transpeptidase ErfK/SrfK